VLRSFALWQLAINEFGARVRQSICSVQFHELHSSPRDVNTGIHHHASPALGESFFGSPSGYQLPCSFIFSFFCSSHAKYH